MSLRLRLALTVFLTGLATAVGVIVAVALAFQRFDQEGTWQRGDAFLSRVLAEHPDLLDQHRNDAEAFGGFLRSLLLFEPNSQLYLLAADGTVLAHTGRAQLAPGFKVALPPVKLAAAAAGRADRSAAYVMGDDPEFMDSDAVIAARVLRRSVIRASTEAEGYLYLVCRKPGLPAPRAALLWQSLATPAAASVLAVIVFTTLLAAWIIITVTRPLRVLTDEVAMAAREGFSMTAGVAALPSLPARTTRTTRAARSGPDEVGRLRGGFHALLGTLRLQWDELSRLDRFRRESVSNLSHDLRSPLTATVACLETLDARWQADPARADDRRLVAMALRNTRNAAGMVRSLGDLALLDEPTFSLKAVRLDLAEVLDGIALRYAERAQAQGVALRFDGASAAAEVDVELFERAVANLLDNALKHTPAGGSVSLALEQQAGWVRVSVADTGRGIPAADLPHLFDRLYQARQGSDSVAPATSEEGKGLGLTIVKRIVELHRGEVAVASTLGAGTTVSLRFPA